MEATPSLACANKCVFCWRHHSNPVGTEWKWLMDEPDRVRIPGSPFSLKRKRLPKNVKRFGYQGSLSYQFTYILAGFLKSYLYI